MENMKNMKNMENMNFHKLRNKNLHKKIIYIKKYYWKINPKVLITFSILFFNFSFSSLLIWWKSSLYEVMESCFDVVKMPPGRREEKKTSGSCSLMETMTLKITQTIEKRFKIIEGKRKENTFWVIVKDHLSCHRKLRRGDCQMANGSNIVFFFL